MMIRKSSLFLTRAVAQCGAKRMECAELAPAFLRAHRTMLKRRQAARTPYASRVTQCVGGRKVTAFTLIEVLIAIAVFAIILAAIHSIFYSALRLRNRTLAAVDEAAPLDHAFAVMRKDLANIVPPHGTNYTLQTTVLSQPQFGQVTPDIYTSVGELDGLSPFGDIEKVSYGLVAGANGSRDLVRLVTRNLHSTTTEIPDPQWLLGNVSSVAFHYFDGAQWAESWDTTTQSNLPTAIKVDLDVNNNLMHMVVALDTQVRTNQ
jgi:type II secretion system protein J